MNQLTIWSQQQNKSIGLTQPRHRVETAWPLQYPHNPDLRQDCRREQAQGSQSDTEAIVYSKYFGVFRKFTTFALRLGGVAKRLNHGLVP